MNEQQNIDLTKKIFAAFGEGNIQVLLEAIAENVEWHLVGAEHIAHAGIYHGRDRVMEMLKFVGKTLELQKFEPLDFIAQNNKVVVIGHGIGRVRPTNCKVSYDWLHVHTFQDGKIVKFQDFFDTAVIAAGYQGVKGGESLARS